MHPPVSEQVDATLHPIRVLIAKPGLDGHDKGAKVLVNVLRDGGMEVIYTGLHQRPEQVVRAAIQEDVDILGLSFLSGAHLGLTSATIDLLHKEGADDILVFVGGTIPLRDRPALLEMGAVGVFDGTSTYEEMIAGLTDAVMAKRTAAS